MLKRAAEKNTAGVMVLLPLTQLIQMKFRNPGFDLDVKTVWVMRYFKTFSMARMFTGDLLKTASPKPANMYMW